MLFMSVPSCLYIQLKYGLCWGEMKESQSHPAHVRRWMRAYERRGVGIHFFSRCDCNAVPSPVQALLGEELVKKYDRERTMSPHSIKCILIYRLIEYQDRQRCFRDDVRSEKGCGMPFHVQSFERAG